MSDLLQNPRPMHGDAISPRLAAHWVWLAGLVILAMASFGLYRGIIGVQGGAASLLGAPHLGLAAPLDAKSAAALPHDAQWSTLNGPKVLPPPPPKVVKPAATDDSDDDSSAPEDQSAAADQAGGPSFDMPPPNAAQAPGQAGPAGEAPSPPGSAPQAAPPPRLPPGTY